MAFHHFENRREFIYEAARVIKNGGRIYIVELRLPEMIRKFTNAIMRHLNIAGNFFTANEICSEFEKAGIQTDGCVKEGLVQIICLMQTQGCVGN